MKEIVTCNLSDGIGKQLFQIAAVINYSKKYHKTPFFHHNVTSLVTDKVDLFSKDMLSNIKFSNLNEKEGDDLLHEMCNNVTLNGDFQKVQYIDQDVFIYMQDIIYNNEEYMYKAYNEYNKIKAFFNTDDDDDLIAIHVRARNNYINKEYFEKAFATAIKNKKTVFPVVFSTNNYLCQNNLTFLEKAYYVNTGNTCIDFILMSFFQNNILDDSFFGWWATFISNYNSKFVIAPINWKSNLYQNKWILI